MDWQSRIPDGVGDIEDTADGFEAKVSIPADEGGYIGRLCSGCGGKFRMLADEYAALPDTTRLTCPYCGRSGEPGDFMTKAQLERAEAALHAVAEQFMHQQIDDMLGRTFGRSRRLRPGESGVEITYPPAPRPPIRTLPEIVEERVLRTITCPNCGTHYAVYGASAFCPVCGPRAATDTVLEAIAAARGALALEDHLPVDQRDAARAAGVFDRLAADTVKNIVSLFEVFAREQFPARATNPAAALQGKGNIFQRLDDTAAQFKTHCGIDLPNIAGAQVWQDLRETFARRHVLVHRDGIVDQKFLNTVPTSGLAIGQRLVITRADAERALDDVETTIKALAAQP
jgi:endogenous inhibitor of DNA gyrase (YacG/DUF329 family)